MSEKKMHPIVIMILVLYPLVGMGIDLIAPSLPNICDSLQISNTLSKNLIAIFLLGYAVSNLICGFLSDAMGRKKLLLGGLLVFTVASLLPAIFLSYPILLFARLLQGAAMGTFGVIARAILSDIVPEDQLKKTFVWLATMWGVGPIMGPIIGGYLQHYFGWQSCFYFFALFGAIGFTMMFFTLTETLAQLKPLNIKLIRDNFKTITTNNTFIGIVILMGASYSMILVFSTLGPFLIQIELQKTALYFGHFALWMGCIFLLGTFICRYLVQQKTSVYIIRLAIFFAAVVTITSIVVAHFYPINILLIAIPSALYFLLTGILFPTAMGMAISLFRHLAGSASAIMNFINVSIAALVSLGMSFVDKGSDAIFWIYGFLTLIITVCYVSCIRLNTHP